MIKELRDRWILGLRSIRVMAVTQASEKPELAIILADGTELTVSGHVHLTHGSAAAPGVVSLPVEDTAKLVGATVMSAVTFKSGSLRIVFSTGHHLNVHALSPELAVHLSKPGDFDWSYRGGVGSMKVPDSGA